MSNRAVVAGAGVFRRDLYIPYRQIHERIAAMIRGRVAHITCARNLRSIRRLGVLANVDGKLKDGYGFSTNAYFRNRNHVSLFDGRNIEPKAFDDEWIKCGPHHVLRSCAQRIALLFLAPTSYGKLVSWQEWKREEAWVEMLVPYIETGYPAPLPFSAIEEVVVVRSKRPAPSPLERALIGVNAIAAEPKPSRSNV